MPCNEAVQLLWGCYFCFFSHHLSKKKKGILHVLWITKKKIYSKWLCCICDLCPFISLPAIKEFSLKSPTLCNCLRARTALKPGLNYKVLLTKLFQSQAWKKKKNHTLNWYRYASNTLCIDARIPLLVWLMSLKKVVGEKKTLFANICFSFSTAQPTKPLYLGQMIPSFSTIEFCLGEYTMSVLSLHPGLSPKLSF